MNGSVSDREAYEQKKLLISVLKSELGEKVRQAFSTVVQLELLYFDQERESMEGEEKQGDSAEKAEETRSISPFQSLSARSSKNSSDSSSSSLSYSSISSLSDSSISSLSYSASDNTSSNPGAIQSEESSASEESDLTAQFLSLYRRVHSLEAFPVFNKHSIEIQ